MVIFTLAEDDGQKMGRGGEKIVMIIENFVCVCGQSGLSKQAGK